MDKYVFPNRYEQICMNETQNAHNSFSQKSFEDSKILAEQEESEKEKVKLLFTRLQVIVISVGIIIPILLIIDAYDSYGLFMSILTFGIGVPLLLVIPVCLAIGRMLDRIESDKLKRVENAFMIKSKNLESENAVIKDNIDNNNAERIAEYKVQFDAAVQQRTITLAGNELVEQVSKIVSEDIIEKYKANGTKASMKFIVFCDRIEYGTDRIEYGQMGWDNIQDDVTIAAVAWALCSAIELEVLSQFTIDSQGRTVSVRKNVSYEYDSAEGVISCEPGVVAAKKLDSWT